MTLTFRHSLFPLAIIASTLSACHPTVDVRPDPLALSISATLTTSLRHGHPPPSITLFGTPVATPCGTVETSSYCPTHRTVLLDVPGMGDYPGEDPTAYVVAHEFGHHAHDVTRPDAFALYGVMVADTRRSEGEADAWAGRLLCGLRGFEDAVETASLVGDTDTHGAERVEAMRRGCP